MPSIECQYPKIVKSSFLQFYLDINGTCEMCLHTESVKVAQNLPSTHDCRKFRHTFIFDQNDIFEAETP